MTILEAIGARHSVRSYLDKTIPDSIIAELKKEIDVCNAEGDLHIQLVTNEPKAFDGIMAQYGKFSGVQNYIALVGKRDGQRDEKLGYYGERIALTAQTLGLNTCWVAMSFSKGTAKRNITMGQDENLVCVLSLGYGATQGVSHKSKPMETLCKHEGELPNWFRSGAEAAMLAPTAVNQQRFLITLDGDTVKFKNLGGFYSAVDLGIVKYHFEVGSGRKVE